VGNVIANQPTTKRTTIVAINAKSSHFALRVCCRRISSLSAVYSSLWKCMCMFIDGDLISDNNQNEIVKKVVTKGSLSLTMGEGERSSLLSKIVPYCKTSLCTSDMPI
jgi:hypothetical protein